MIKILSLQRESHVAPGVPSLSVSARITEMLEYLSEQKKIQFISLSEIEPSCFNAVKWADLIVLNKHSSKCSLDLVRYAKRMNKKIIYDIDDWIFEYPMYSGGYIPGGEREKIIWEIIANSDYVTVANQRIEKRLSHLSNVVLINNGIWVEKYLKIPDFEFTLSAPSPRIAFTNADFLKLNSAKGKVLAALQIFFLGHKNLSLDFYGDIFPEIFTLPFLSYTNRLPYDKYLKSLVNGNYIFSITPLSGSEDLESHEFNSCKNPFKYLNYGAAGIPGIYSRSLIYEDCIVDRENGILVNNNYEDWLATMEELTVDDSLRSKIKRNAYYDIFKNYHIKIGAKLFLNLL
jgi:glycosyltransferase involved in cell wall biosynthesis